MGVAIAVALVAFLPYFQSGKFELINLDDYRYVVYCPVSNGLSWSNAGWALTDVRAMANWHPLTYLSFMTDVSLFGANPKAMHLVNAGMHAVAAGMLFFLLSALLAGPDCNRKWVVPKTVCGDGGEASWPTAILWAAAFGALAWALHPLRVESVAWISSRKDVLSVLFCLAGLMAHLGDVRAWRGEKARESDWRRLLDGTALENCSWRWWGALACFVLGYMAKPTMMMFPAFIALIEWLEAGRVRWKPLLLYAAGAVVFLVVTVYAQGEGGAITTDYPIPYRVLNATVSISIYLRQFVIPEGLAIFYPYDQALTPGMIASGFSCILGLGALAFACWTRAPVVTCGVVWFLVALIPLLGFIQVGGASHADRYTYLSTIGLSLILATILHGLLRQGRWTAHAARWGAIGLLSVLMFLSWRQIGLWRDDPTLFSHALTVTDGNFLAHRNLGIYAYSRYQDHETAIKHLSAFLKMSNRQYFPEPALYVLILAESGHMEEAKTEARRLTEEVDRAYEKKELSTFIAYSAIAYYEGDRELAKKHAEYVCERVKNHPDANYLLGLIARDAGKLDDAIAFWKRSLKGDFQYQFMEPRIRELERQTRRIAP